MSDFFPKRINAMDLSRPVQKNLHGVMMVQLGIKNEAKEKAASAEKSANWGHLNDAGRKAAKRDQLSDLFKSNVLAKLHMKKIRAEIAASAPKMPELDKADVVGFLRDQELRAYVRGLPQEQRDRYQRLNPEIAAAVARMPAELSGISPSVHAELVKDILTKTHDADFIKIAADLDAVEWAEELIRAAGAEIKSAGDFAHETEFRMWAKPVLEPILAEEKIEFGAVFQRTPNVENAA